MTLTYGSLFTGVGGFDLGFDQAGYDCRWQVEWDKNCQQVLGHHWPDVPKWGDIQDVYACTCRSIQPISAQQRMEHVDGSSTTNQSRCACGGIEPVDIITYGSPCQDLSVAGKRAGLDGGRSSMFFEATRIFQEMRNATDGTFPRITVWENVPGALSSNNGDDFRTVLQTLDDIGALAQWWYVLDAQYFGVPQRRRRVFVISVFDPAVIERAGDGQILPVGESRRRNPPTSDKTRQDPSTNVARSIGFSHTQGLDPQPSEVATPTLRSNGSGMAVATNFDEYNFTGGNDIHYQIRAGTRQSTGVLQNTIVRRLTPTECERLMGWPDNHTLHRADGKTNSDTTRYKMCGNGVATPVAQWIATQLKELL